MVKNLNSLVVVVTCFIFSCCNTLNASYSKGIHKKNSANNCKKETVYIEKNGIVRVDLKNSGASNNEWSSQNILDGYTGSDYLIWRGADNFNTPGNGRLVYTIKIKHSGTYQFVWKSRIGEGDSNTEHNDSWLRISADSFYGEKSSTGQRVYPKGSGKTPNPEGASKNGWLKIYMNKLGEWTWKSHTNDKDPYNIFVNFEKPGIYDVEISGRSKSHAIDQFVLFRTDKTLTQAQNAKLSKITCK